MYYRLIKTPLSVSKGCWGRRRCSKIFFSLKTKSFGSINTASSPTALLSCRRRRSARQRPRSANERPGRGQVATGSQWEAGRSCDPALSSLSRPSLHPSTQPQLTAVWNIFWDNPVKYFWSQRVKRNIFLTNCSQTWLCLSVGVAHYELCGPDVPAIQYQLLPHLLHPGTSSSSSSDNINVAQLSPGLSRPSRPSPSQEGDLGQGRNQQQHSRDVCDPGLLVETRVLHSIPRNCWRNFSYAIKTLLKAPKPP